MAIVVPNVGEVELSSRGLNQNLILKLFSNNKTPAAADISADYTEVAGGGYVNKTLTFGNWIIVAGSPSRATYNAHQNFAFTGVTNAPGTIYGYFLVNLSNVLMWVERFPVAQVPFVPKNGALIKLKPIITFASVSND